MPLGAGELVRFLRATTRVTRRKALTGKDGVMVSPAFASWNQLGLWLRAVDGLKSVA